MEYKQLEELIIKWAKDRGILCPENQLKQMLKCASEVGELADALIKVDLKEIVDGLGDVLVTLIILSEQLGLDLMTCLESAYDEIKSREGKTIDGVFIKDNL